MISKAYTRLRPVGYLRNINFGDPCLYPKRIRTPSFARGIVRNAVRPGQVFDAADVPMENSSLGVERGQNNERAISLLG